VTEPTERVEQVAASAGAWIFSSQAVADLARESVSFIEAANPMDVARVVSLIGAKSTESAGGTMFEFMQGFNFNRQAWLEGSATVAKMTAAHDHKAAADLVIIGPNDNVIREIQAKAYADPGQALRKVLDPKYEGMDVIVPDGQLADLRAKIAKGLNQPEGNIYHPRFQDLDQHVGDVIKADGLRGKPVSLETARAHRDPRGWIEEQRRAAVLEEAVAGTLKAGAVGFAAGAGLTAVVRGTIAALHRDDDVPVSRIVADIARASAVSGVRSGAVSAMANLARVGIHEAGVAHGSDALRFASQGATPFVAANLVASVAELGFRFAQGDIDRRELIESCSQEALRNSVGWAFGVVGQVAIPIPVVGAAVGAVVGYTVSAAVMEGLKFAAAAAVVADAAEARVQLLKVEVVAACQSLEEERTRLQLLQREEHATFVQHLMPALAQTEAAARRGDESAFLDGLIDLNRALGAKLDWSTREEFDQLMADPNWALEL
jgi:hypothetical protein